MPKQKASRKAYPGQGRRYRSSQYPNAGTHSDNAERLRAILETAVEAIITIDDRGRIESLNPAAERLFGYQVSELIGRNVSVLMPAPHRAEHDGHIASYLRTGDAKVIGVGREVVAQKKDGTVFSVELSVSEVKLANGRLFTGFIRDISERKRTEEKLASLARSLAEKNRELETIVYVASHDLRSPLVNIQGFSEELAHSCSRLCAWLESGEVRSQSDWKKLIVGEVNEAIGFIQAGVSKIDLLLAGLLQYSRLGRAVLKPRRLAMGQLLSSIAEAMEFQIKQAGASLEIEALPACWGDPIQINQVFSNLIENAVKYLDPARSGRIVISGRIEAGQSIYSIRDNGIGIARNEQDRIFEIFHRLDPARGSGEGLGLTIAQRILERHGGSIRVESEPGQGSTFFVSLPTAAQAESRA